MMSDYSNINSFGGTKINTPTKSSEQGTEMPIKVIFAFFLVAVLLGILLYHAPVSFVVVVFGFAVAWAIHTILYYFAEKRNRP